MVRRCALVFGWTFLVLSTLSLAACAKGSELKYVKAKGCKHPFGPVVMQKDRTIVINYRHGSDGFKPYPLIYHPDQGNYQNIAQMYSDLMPGESKIYCGHDHSVHMNDDGSFWVSNADARLEVGGHAPDAPIKPDDPAYKLLLNRVGSLKPGEAKGWDD